MEARSPHLLRGRCPGALHPVGHRAGERHEGLRVSGIEMHALRPAHLWGFRSMGPLAPIPDGQWGEAVAFIRPGEELGIAGGWPTGDAVGLGLLRSPEARSHPAAMPKTPPQGPR